MSGKAAILERIRKSLSVPQNDGHRLKAVMDRINSAPPGIIPARGQLEHDAKLDLFIAKAEQVQTTVDRVKDKDEIPELVASYLRQHNLPTRLHSGSDKRISDIPWDKTPQLQVENKICKEADSVSISYGDVGIAETGTISVFSGPDAPTGNNFLPQTHIVVIDAESVKSDFEGVWQFVRTKFGKGAMPRTINFISGPSRSADIEQTLLLGAHGPRALHLIIVD